jgi:hypothetical protein
LQDLLCHLQIFALVVAHDEDVPFEPDAEEELLNSQLKPLELQVQEVNDVEVDDAQGNQEPKEE